MNRNTGIKILKSQRVDLHDGKVTLTDLGENSEELGDDDLESEGDQENVSGDCLYSDASEDALQLSEDATHVSEDYNINCKEDLDCDEELWQLALKVPQLFLKIV